MPPGSIVIPPSHRTALQELAKLSDEAFGTLRQCLVEDDGHSEPSDLIERTSKAVESHSRVGGQILAAVIGMRSFLDGANMESSDVAAGAALDGESKGFLSAELARKLSTRLVELLDTRAVIIASKAYSLVLADASPFSDVRIVSDVRPIFLGKEDALEFAGSVIVHHLRVEVSEGDDLHSALTTSDLLKLKRTVERALEKDRRLRETLRNSSVGPLEPSQGPKLT